LSTLPVKPWSYVVLALIGEGGAGPHDLVDMMRRGGRRFYAAAPSQVYAEPKRLAGLGYVTAEKAAGQTHERTVYRLTDAGREALAAWAAEPTPFARIQSEANVRLLAGGLVADDALAASLLALRAEVDDLDALLTESERALGALPEERRRYLRLSFGLGRRFLDAHRDWLDDVERELGGGPGAAP
jgi:PadR family transcriptional regulator, regulatory protein AphA